MAITDYAAARLVVGAGEFDHATPVLLDDLHWLPVPQRIQFKVALTASDCVRGSAWSSVFQGRLHSIGRHL